ncbi:ISXoo13 transposase, partial [mine drainage metagenome]
PTITFDKFHVIAHASERSTRCAARAEARPSLKGKRWVLLKDRAALTAAQRTELDRLLAKMTTTRTARAWQYREELREILTRKQPNVARLLLNRWCSNVLRSKVEPMKEVAQMIRNHLEGILAWVTSRQTNGFLEAINGLFQAAKRKARGYGRFRTIRMVIFMIAGKLDFSRINPYVTASKDRSLSRDCRQPVAEHAETSGYTDIRRNWWLKRVTFITRILVTQRACAQNATCRSRPV